MSPEWLYLLTLRSQLTRIFSLLSGLGVLILFDGLILIRLARITGIYYALALEGIVSIVAAVVLGSTANSLIRKIRADAVNGSCIISRYARLAAVVTAGILLFIPGFATDGIGLLIYLPPGRMLYALLFRRRNEETVKRSYEYLTMELFASPSSRGEDDE